MNEFWNNFSQWWVKLFESIGNWALTPDTNGMSNLMKWIIALAVLIVGHYLIKLIMKIARKVAGVKTNLSVDVSVKTFTLSVLNVVLSSLLAVIFLGIIGVDFSSVASILSAVTVAIGLALQDLISAFASGVVLLKSKHFKTGDYVMVTHDCGTCEGTVTEVGILATVLLTVGKQKVIIPNNKVLQGVITNYSAETDRRLCFDIGVDYDTDIKFCRQVMLGVAKKDTRILSNPEPAVVVADFADSAITMSLRCYIKQKNYWDVYFQIREDMFEAFKANNINIPYTQIVLHNGDTPTPSNK